QDLHAQLAAMWLEINPEHRVLDACAAPGGKTSHILEHCPALKELVALDQDPSRLEQITETLERLSLSAKLICADARDTGSWWDGQLFDRILLDAPCSGTGVIRRHPDIKLLRRKPDIENYAKIQKELLTALWPLLAPNGMLLYATCSILPQENSEVIDYFLKTTPDCRHQPISNTQSTKSEYGCQLLTTTDGGDGFFYAKLIKA
nr:16S rRNA (cytosine(967)-C(5))-methyltransferase [Pseudomonadota bacterium]